MAAREETEHQSSHGFHGLNGFHGFQMALIRAEFEPVTHEIIGSALKIHRDLGCGMFENIYKLVLADDLVRKGLLVQTEVAFPLIYEGRRFDKAFKVDLLVANAVIVEVKSVQAFAPEHFQQIIAYLKLLKLKVGLLLNFGTASLAIKRMLNNP